MTRGAGPRVAIYFQMFSPYIVARLNGAADRLNVVGVEGSRRSARYAWEPRLGDDRFPRVTLYEDTVVDSLPPSVTMAKMAAVLDEVDPDVLVIGGWATTETLAGLRWARDRGRHAVVMSESTLIDAPRTPWREIVKRRIVGQYDAALVGGAPQRAYLESLGMPRERIFQGYDAVDNDWFVAGADRARVNAETVRAELGLPDRYFLASNRFIEKKNLPRLIEAFAAYRAGASADAWDLVLLGDGELRPALETQVAALGLTGAVQFAGFRQYDVLPLYYGLAGAFVHLSTVEQWGLVVNEAMAAGLPVIVSRNCGCATDLVEDGANGWTVEPLDVPGIADRLAQMAAPATDRQAMGRQSRERIAAFGPDSFGAGLAAAVAAATAGPCVPGNALDRLLLTAVARWGKRGE